MASKERPQMFDQQMKMSLCGFQPTWHRLHLNESDDKAPVDREIFHLLASYFFSTLSPSLVILRRRMTSRKVEQKLSRHEPTQNSNSQGGMRANQQFLWPKRQAYLFSRPDSAPWYGWIFISNRVLSNLELEKKGLGLSNCSAQLSLH